MANNKFQDMTGMRFGRYVALRLGERSKSGKIQWVCRCDCGVEKSVLGEGLRSGISASCGCSRLKSDVTGKRFGRLTVISRASNGKSGSPVWNCLCDCGNMTRQQTSSLKLGAAISCGCSRIKDLIGQRFGRLVVLRRGPDAKCGKLQWLCKCDCGKETVVLKKNLLRYDTVSCGCFRASQDGATGYPEFSNYYSMMSRCCNPDVAEYALYGGAGITVCEHWKSTFFNFYADMGPKPTPKHTIDRYPNQKGNYEPGNCRWATMKEQARNKTNNVNITFNGKTQCVSAWAEETGIAHGVIRQRLKNGWTIAEALDSSFKYRKTK